MPRRPPHPVSAASCQTPRARVPPRFLPALAGQGSHPTVPALPRQSCAVPVPPPSDLASTFLPRDAPVRVASPRAPSLQSTPPPVPAQTSPSKSVDQGEQTAFSARHRRRNAALLVHPEDQMLQPAKSRECAKISGLLLHSGKLHIHS